MTADPDYVSARAKVSTWHADEKHPEKWVPLTHAELDALSIEVSKDLGSFEEAHGNPWSRAPNREDFTCFRCSSASTCLYVYDMYNTDGECLASK